MPTGEKAQNEPQKKPVKTDGHRRGVVMTVILGIALIVTLVIVATTSGFGPPEVADGDIAVVDGVDPSGIPDEDFATSFAQQAGAQGLNQPPEEGDDTYEQVKEAAVDDLLLSRWVLGEAQERGISASDREVEQELEKVKTQNFGSDEEFEQFLDESSMTLDQAMSRVRLQVLSTRIQDEIVTAEPKIEDDEVQDFYDDNVATLYTAPEQRDVRIITAASADDAQAAFDALSDDDTPESWIEVAKQYSTDETTKATGGLNTAITVDALDPETSALVFSSDKGVLAGPFETANGSIVIQVQEITPSTVTPFDEVRDQIRQTLIQQIQQTESANFQNEFIARWTARTICAEGYETTRCANAPPARDTCSGDDPNEDTPTDESGEPTEIACPAPVVSVPVVSPGSAGLGAVAPRLYQGPQSPFDATLAGSQILGSLPPQ